MGRLNGVKVVIGPLNQARKIQSRELHPVFCPKNFHDGSTNILPRKVARSQFVIQGNVNVNSKGLLAICASRIMLRV